MQRDPGGQSAISERFGWVLVSVSVGFYGLLCLILYRAVYAANGGHFFYSLDDAYIHLALSEQIARGHYGINVGEAASPSSSMAWPLLLALFARFRWQAIVPLLLNFAAGVAAAVLMARAVAEWPGGVARREEKLRRVVSVVALVLIGNLVGLTFLGMEHTLQVMLAVACGLGITAALRGDRIPLWCLVAAAVGPMVRYEAVGLVLALAIALVGQGRRRAAGVLVAASAAPLLGFAVFLHHVGLPPLPVSVLVKADVVALDGTSPWALHGALIHHILHTMRNSLAQSVTHLDHAVLLILFLTLAALGWRERVRGRKFVLLGVAAAAGLHILIGRYNWSHRYEVYIVVFSAMVVLYVLHERPRQMLGWYALGLVACSATYVGAAGETVFKAHEVYLQQRQTQRFLTEFYAGNVAVNDLGLASYHHRPGTEVLDLFGLGSLDSAEHDDKTAEWMDAVTREHGDGLVAISRGWFPDIPGSWTMLGELCAIRQPVTMGDNCVDYYVTPMAPVEQTQAEFAAFVKTLPAGVSVSMGAGAVR
jgi:hypothetical protein